MAEFDRPLAATLLEICRQTYAAGLDSAANASPRRVVDAKGVAGTLEILRDPRAVKTSIAAVVAYPDRNVVAYMGTKTNAKSTSALIASIKDWDQNLEALPVPFRLGEAQLGGLVHHGFLDELAAVHDQVVAKLLERGGRQKEIVVTGHSQGGAEATLATRALLEGGFKLAATYTFAAPRAGNRAFVETIPRSHAFHRIEFGDDIVPHVPPALLSARLADILEAASHSPLLPQDVRELLTWIGRSASYAHAGRLCYGDRRDKKLRVDLSDEAEKELFEKRLLRLAFNPVGWAEHHHLIGTRKDVERQRRGNYSALVSDYELAG